MAVEVVHFSDATLRLGSFMRDISESYDAARSAGDLAASQRLRQLWLGYLHNDLKAMTSRQFDAYFSTRQTWQSSGDWTIIKTPDLPCIAYTAQANLDNSVTVIALGAVWRYPGGNELGWWTGVILPRVRLL